MLSAVEFDDQICGVADEVYDVRADWRLTTKTRSIQAMRAQCVPNDSFSIGRIVAKLSRSRPHFS
jgi:hypothetical protein